MDRKTVVIFAGLSLAALAVVGCDQKAEPPANDAAPVGAAANDTEAATPAAADSPVFPLSLQQTSEAGISVQLTSIQMLATETVVGVKIVNNLNRTAELNRKSYLSGGNGAQFEMRAPEGNEYLKVAPTQTLTGELVFEGRPPAGSDAVLVINEGYRDYPQQGTPPMTFQIPLVQLGYK